MQRDERYHETLDGRWWPSRVWRLSPPRWVDGEDGVGDRPLVGVRVLELAGGIAGPYGGKLLSDLGAEVVKAEPPSGDVARLRGPFRDGHPDPEASGFYLYLNAGKCGITLDLDAEA